jgi:hypothetical protein
VVDAAALVAGAVDLRAAVASQSVDVG